MNARQIARSDNTTICGNQGHGNQDESSADDARLRRGMEPRVEIGQAQHPDCGEQAEDGAKEQRRRNAR
jgi:hypothetical protein